MSRLVISFLLCFAYSAQAKVEPQALQWKEFRGITYQAGDLYIAGQPLSQAAMDHLKTAGVTDIVNLRTPEEMADRKSTPIEEEKLSASLNIAYHHLPSGGEKHPYSDDTVAAFAEVLDLAEGPVFLHCNSGRRAAHLWVAYLVRHQGMSLSDAVTLGKSANFGAVPLEGYLAAPVYGSNQPM